MAPVSIVILTYNEEVNIARCLERLRWSDDVIIVDSGSSDSTCVLARKTRQDVRIHENPFEDFGQQRNWALDHTSPKHDWILFLDADEFVTRPFVKELAEFVASPGRAAGAYIAGRNYFLGRWLKHSTLYPSYQLRLLKRGEVRYRKEGHGQREVTDGPLHYFKEGWRHEGFSKGIEQWIARHNRYSTDEVDLLLRLRSEPVSLGSCLSRDPIVRRRALKVLGAKIPGRPISRFLYVYLMRRGILDGYAGFLFALLRLAHDLHIVTKIAERKYLQEKRDEFPSPPRSGGETR